MASEIPSEIVEAVFRTTKVPGCKGVYNLSPNGSRVGIYFQQRRALVLAWAIAKEYGAGAHKKLDIAVIGGGVSGLTFFKALKKLGFQRIKLYEKQSEILTHYDESEVRLVHPNYNRWPMLDEPLSFTKLPVLNWYAGTAASVLKRIKAQFEGANPTKAYDSVFKGWQCLSIENTPSGDGKSTVKFKKNGVDHQLDFDIVVVASGFGADTKSELGFRAYWNKNVSDEFDPGKNHLRASQVFGSGDGALIDLLQCCSADPVNSHRIPLQLIGHLRDERAIALPKKNRENNIGSEQDSEKSIYSALEQEIRNHELNSRALVWKLVEHSKTRDAKIRYQHLMKEEEEFYLGFIPKMLADHASIETFLEDNLKVVPPAALMPILIGLKPSAFEPTSAPINKILLAYLIKTNRVKYMQVTEKASDRLLAHAAEKITRGDRTSINVCRIGAPSNFPHYITISVLSGGTFVPVKFEKEELFISSALSSATGGDFVPIDAFPDAWARAAGGQREDNEYEVISESFTLVEDYAREKFDGKMIWDRGKNPRQLSLRTYLTRDEFKDRAREHGGIDRYIFGLPVTFGEQLEIPREPF